MYQLFLTTVSLIVLAINTGRRIAPDEEKSTDSSHKYRDGEIRMLDHLLPKQVMMIKTPEKRADEISLDYEK